MIVIRSNWIDQGTKTLGTAPPSSTLTARQTGRGVTASIDACNLGWSLSVEPPLIAGRSALRV